MLMIGLPNVVNVLFLFLHLLLVLGMLRGFGLALLNSDMLLDFPQLTLDALDLLYE